MITNTLKKGLLLMSLVGLGQENAYSDISVARSTAACSALTVALNAILNFDIYLKFAKHDKKALGKEIGKNALRGAALGLLLSLSYNRLGLIKGQKSEWIALSAAIHAVIGGLDPWQVAQDRKECPKNSDLAKRIAERASLNAAWGALLGFMTS